MSNPNEPAPVEPMPAVRARAAWDRIRERAKLQPMTVGRDLTPALVQEEIAREVQALATALAEQHAVELANVHGDLTAQVAQLNERIAAMGGELSRTKKALREALSGRKPVMGVLIGPREKIEQRVRGLGRLLHSDVVKFRETAIDELVRYGLTEDRIKIVQLADLSFEPYTISADAETT